MQDDTSSGRAHHQAQPAFLLHSFPTRKAESKTENCNAFSSSNFCVFGTCQFLSLTFFPPLHGCFLCCLTQFSFLSQFFPQISYISANSPVNHFPFLFYTFLHLPSPWPMPLATRNLSLCFFHNLSLHSHFGYVILSAPREAQGYKVETPFFSGVG